MRRKRKFRRGRRGGEKKKISSVDKGEIILFHNNIRGFTSKKESLQKIIDCVKPDIVSLNETGLNGLNKVKLYGYSSFSRNRKEKSMGGVSTSVKEELKTHTVNIKEGDNDDEFIIICINHVKPAICIINWYGEQECRSSKEDILARWLRVKKEMETIRSRGDSVLLVGDLNKKVGADRWGVVGNNDKVSYGGQLIRDMLATEEFMLINNTKAAQGGAFTWEDPGNPGRKACLDLFICSADLFPFVKSLVIDSSRKFAPKQQFTARENSESSIQTITPVS